MTLPSPAPYTPETLGRIRAMVAKKFSVNAMAVALGWDAERIVRIGRHHGIDVVAIDPVASSVEPESKPAPVPEKKMHRTRPPRADDVSLDIGTMEIITTPMAAELYVRLRHGAAMAKSGPVLAKQMDVPLHRIGTAAEALSGALDRSDAPIMLCKKVACGYWLEDRIEQHAEAAE